MSRHFAAKNKWQVGKTTKKEEKTRRGELTLMMKLGVWRWSLNSPASPVFESPIISRHHIKLMVNLPGDVAASQEGSQFNWFHQRKYNGLITFIRYKM